MAEVIFSIFFIIICRFIIIYFAKGLSETQSESKKSSGESTRFIKELDTETDEEDTKDNSGQNTAISKNKAYVKMMLYLMCDIIITNENNKDYDLEMDVIKDFIRNNEPYKYDEHMELVGKILECGPLPYDEKVEYCDAIFEIYSRLKREQMWNYLLRIAYADKDFSITEDAYLTTIYGHMFEDSSSRIKNDYDKNDDDLNYKPNFLNPKEYVKVMLYLMCDIVVADKSKMVSELDVIKEFIKKNENNKYEEHLRLVKRLLKNNNSIPYLKKEEYCKMLHNHFTLKEREILIDYLYMVAYADGECSSQEQVCLRFIHDRVFDGTTSYEMFKYFRLKYDTINNQKRKNQWNSSQSDNSNNSNRSQNSSENSSQNHKTVLTEELRKAYAALGITEDASDSQIKARWRNLMRINHPDKVASKGAEAVESATLKCQELNKEFEKIKASRGMK